MTIGDEMLFAVELESTLTSIALDHWKPCYDLYVTNTCDASAGCRGTRPTVSDRGQRVSITSRRLMLCKCPDVIHFDSALPRDLHFACQRRDHRPNERSVEKFRTLERLTASATAQRLSNQRTIQEGLTQRQKKDEIAAVWGRDMYFGGTYQSHP